MFKILIVEDTLTIREEIHDILVMEGYTVFEAENGSIGFEIALKKHPDLIISDILMPKLNGFEMYKKLQNNKTTKLIPLIFLSAKAEKSDIRAGMNLGAEDYLTKPIDVEDLLNTVKIKIDKKLLLAQETIDKTTTISAILQQQKKELDNYAQLISHELKTPLRNISDILIWIREELAHPISSENSINSIELLEKKVERMELLLTKLEQYKNIRSSSFKKNKINLNTIAKKVIAKLQVPSHIKIEIKNKLPTLFADEIMLEKVFEILIQNALDHIDKKKGLILLACETTEEDYLFSIKDNGIGIKTKYHEKIFEMFQTIDSNNSTGIGLSIVKKIISYYNGEVKVESKTNKETIFYFSLPKKGTMNALLTSDYLKNKDHDTLSN
ncbi:hybrid sensor histidine kinase/response regulator [uncultured Polaribacter sp.]|uniref:hybrid sensor histidine kinase/response regulator n=1 Tax=uncultured Polaribacter sp. TaxID=174711 RepID=UPI0030DB81C8